MAESPWLDPEWFDETMTMARELSERLAIPVPNDGYLVTVNSCRLASASSLGTMVEAMTEAETVRNQLPSIAEYFDPEGPRD